MSSTTFTRRVPRVRFPSLSLPFPGRRDRSLERTLDELHAIDPRMAHEVWAMARHQGLA